MADQRVDPHPNEGGQASPVSLISVTFDNARNANGQSLNNRYALYADKAPANNPDDWGQDAILGTPDWRANPPQNQPVCYRMNTKMLVHVALKVTAQNQGFALVGYDGGAEYFRANDLNSGTGQTMTVDMTAANALPNKIDKITKTLTWKVIPAGGNPVTLGDSGPHIIYAIIAKPSPANETSLKRMDWAVDKTKGAVGRLDAAQNIDTALAGSPGGGSRNSENLSGWVVAAANQRCDCYSLAKAAAAGLNMVGVVAVAERAFTTTQTDGHVTLDVCRVAVPDQVFNVRGTQVTAKLCFNFGGSDANVFEGYFYVFDDNAHAVAYTVYPSIAIPQPGNPIDPDRGPFSSDYFSLEVLRKATAPSYVQKWVCVQDYPALGLRVGNALPDPPVAPVNVPQVPAP